MLSFVVTSFLTCIYPETPVEICYRYVNKLCAFSKQLCSTYPGRECVSRNNRFGNSMQRIILSCLLLIEAIYFTAVCLGLT